MSREIHNLISSSEAAPRGRVPVGRRLPARRVAGPHRQRTGDAAAHQLQPGRRPHDHRRAIRPGSCRNRSSARSSTSSTPPAPSCPRWGRGTCPARPGRGRRSPSTPSVTEQSAEKAELASQKMIITELTGTSATWGGYVNVSRQLIDFSNPAAMDLIISDLAQQYALQTENDAADTFLAAATAAISRTSPPASTPTAQVAAAFWGAVGQVYAGTKGAGRVIAAAAPQMLGLLGPLFPFVNPQDAQSLRVPGRQLRAGPRRRDQRCPDLRHRRPRRQQDPRPVDRGSRGVRAARRRAAGHRAVACSVSRSPTPATSPRSSSTPLGIIAITKTPMSEPDGLPQPAKSSGSTRPGWVRAAKPSRKPGPPTTAQPHGWTR